jgi:exopolysaccharide biosynthesis polyprenyl glycosylphosphotransferase
MQEQQPGFPPVEIREVKYAFAKRVFDLVVAIFCLLLLFPVFIVTAILVKMSSPGPIFYRSERIGLGGRPFLFVKFRSMYMDAEARLSELRSKNEHQDGPIFKMKRDPRITPIGRVLRKFSIDELPQLLAVVTGEMSMVGPRPPIRREVEQYDEKCAVRLSIKPGITCYWQIMGRSDLSFEQWMELDRRYVEEMSFWLDFWILVRTPWVILRGKGAY